MPMRTPHFSYVPSQLDTTPMLRRTPFVLAQRALHEGWHAARIDGGTTEETPSRPLPEYPATRAALTLARAPVGAAAPMAATQPPHPVSEVKVQDLPGSSTPEPGSAAAPDAGKLAEQVYTMLARRLLVERERGGYRRY
jgi:hypothetical protein